MNVRSVTCFINVDEHGSHSDAMQQAGQLASATRAALEAAGFPVQTIRLATQPLSCRADDLPNVATQLWNRAARAGFDYLSLGPVLADTPDADLSRLEQIPEVIRTTQAVFASALVAKRGRGLHLEAIQRTAGVIREIAHTTPQGFGNLRLAALANVGPLAPFFPAAYHDGGAPALALAMEAADLAVAAFVPAVSFREARRRLVASVEAASRQIVAAVQPLAEHHDFRFAGIDFSFAPFPEEARSIGTAVERLGAGRFGAPGTLFCAAFLTDCLRQARYPRCGFNGLMFPVLEDATLAARSQEGLFTVNDLLLYASVCGTGLDTVPLPGDIGQEELAGILLDVATLALRLDKPLTARLMPIPGAQAGDATAFDFPYFANGRVLAVKGLGSPGLFQRASWLDSP